MTHSRIYFSSLLLTLLCSMAFVGCRSGAPVEGSAGDVDTVPLTFNADSALKYVEQQCAFGPRTPGSAAHKACGDWLVETFQALGLEVTQQQAFVTGWDGRKLPCRNIVARFMPEAKRRVAVMSHWDSRPWADQAADSSQHHEPVPAANDGASGVAVMLELSRQLANFQPEVGVDFICFDVEDYGAPYWGEGGSDSSDWCLGSQYWATHLDSLYVKPYCGVLLDMVGGRGTQFRYEHYSRRYAEQVLARVWACAETSGASDYFVAADGIATIDDHLPVNQYAGIPTIDIIGLGASGFPDTWHTPADTPENISTDVLRAVGQTLLQWIYEER